MLIIETGKRCLLLGEGCLLVGLGGGACYWDLEEVLVIGTGKRCLLLGLERGAFYWDWEEVLVNWGRGAY